MVEKSQTKEWESVLGYAVLILALIAIIGLSVYWNVSSNTWETIIKISAIACIVYACYYPLRVFLTMIFKKYFPILPKKINLVIMFLSGLLVGFLFPSLIVPYVICNVVGLVTSN